MKYSRHLPQWVATVIVVALVSGFTFRSVLVGFVALVITVTLILLFLLTRRPRR